VQVGLDRTGAFTMAEMKQLMSGFAWLFVATIGAFAYCVLATRQGEPVSSAYLVVAALCTYAVAYRFYAKWLEARVLMLDDRRATPSEIHDDGHDFVKTNSWIVFGHHFAAISGPGPLVGPVLAAQFGYLPGALWILIGVVLGGAVQDFVILVASMRRNGKSLGQMVREELNTFAGNLSLAAILSIMVILLGVLALIVVNALAESPWGVFTVGATIPIAMLMGGYLRWIRSGKALEATVMGVALLLLSVWGGQWVYGHPEMAGHFTFSAETLSWTIIAYGLAASVLPVWLLLAPRDYLSTFMKLGTILALAGGVLLVLPVLKMPAITKFVDGSGPVVPGKVFPFCFITIACGAISGFHSLISSGITPKIISRERLARPIGYGAMCLESLVAIMALIAACTLEPGVYLAMNIKGIGPDAAAVVSDTVTKVQATGFKLDPSTMTDLAQSVGEKSLYGRTGGAATLAVGMAQLFSQLTQGRWLDLWYHFAIMFEALFILTTLDAGTRVGRYLIQDLLGRFWKPLGHTRSLPANVLASALIVGGWGAVLISGVRNPDGGTKALWPIFGIANQLLAAVALCLATTVLLKSGLAPREKGARRSPTLALVTFIPLCWLLAVTFTAGWIKMYDTSPKIGFRALARLQEQKIVDAEKALATTTDLAAQTKLKGALKVASATRINALFDFGITGTFLGIAVVLVLTSMAEWVRLLAGSKLATLCESPIVWLPEVREGETRRGGMLGTAAIVLALLRHWSGETDIERTRTQLEAGHTAPGRERVLIDLPEVRESVLQEQAQDAYVIAAERRFSDVNRCC